MDGVLFSVTKELPVTAEEAVMVREDGDLSAMSFEWLVERMGASLATLRLSGVDPHQVPVDDLRRNIAAIRVAARREGVRKDSGLNAVEELEKLFADPPH